MDGSKALADSTIKRKARQANFGNIWVFESIPGGEVQSFYAIRLTVFTRQRFLRVLQDNGEYVDVSFDRVVGMKLS